jgi:hypothetical protein
LRKLGGTNIAEYSLHLPEKTNNLASLPGFSAREVIRRQRETTKEEILV